MELPPIDAAELEAQALAADPDAPLPADAIPFGVTDEAEGLLPAWYMPSPGSSVTRSPRRRRVAYVLITSFVMINAAGLCSTYGHIVIA